VSLSNTAMKSVGRLLIAFMVFLIQSSIGLAIGGCPNDAVFANNQTSKLACPMGMKSCCACCKHSKNSAGLAAGRCESTCTVKTVSIDQPATLISSLQTATHTVLPRTVEIPTPSLGVVDLPIHRLQSAPRIRPPNSRLHGLRAPPAR